ncbi:hypothetical protein DVH05_002472 [Phytophthora capsici]|nr:hypothetical protein DVH05_002472 [Phytophthora capsici]
MNLPIPMSSLSVLKHVYSTYKYMIYMCTVLYTPQDRAECDGIDANNMHDIITIHCHTLQIAILEASRQKVLVCSSEAAHCGPHIRHAAFATSGSGHQRESVSL